MIVDYHAKPFSHELSRIEPESETKSTLDREERRTKESQKITCGKRHFEELEVDFDVVTFLAEVPV